MDVQHTTDQARREEGPTDEESKAAVEDLVRGWDIAEIDKDAANLSDVLVTNAGEECFERAKTLSCLETDVGGEDDGGIGVHYR